MKMWLRRQLGIWFSNKKWCRRYLGGKWEQWWVDCCASYIWLQVDDFARITGKRPGGRFGTPSEEDYTVTTAE